MATSSFPSSLSSVLDEVSNGNRYITCQYRDNAATFGMWMHENPFNYTVPLIYLQLSAISLVSSLIDAFLQPLGQSVLVAQIVGGILLGPSLLGSPAIMGSSLFPARSKMLLQTLGSLGIMFFLFAIGVRADTKLMLRPGRQAVVIGISSTFITAIFSLLVANAFVKYVSMDDSLAAALPFIAAPQCLSAFSNISCLLIELNIVSSNLGRIATSIALFNEILSISLLIIVYTVLQSAADPQKAGMAIVSVVVFVVGLVCVVRPFIRKSVTRLQTGKPLAEQYTFLCFASILTMGFITELLGQHFTLGPLLLGFLVPDGQPLGAPIISKLDIPIGKFLYPIYLTTSGLKTNILKIDFWSLFVVASLVFTSSLIRVVAVVLAGRFVNISFHDSLVIGLILNAKGVFELLIYNLCRDEEKITDKGFALCVISVVAVTAVITPLIRCLYDPSNDRCVPINRRMIQNSKDDSELRILVCIESQDNVTSIIDLLEASNATEVSPIAVVALVLEELGDRATRMLVAHQSTREVQPGKSKSGHLINALHQYVLRQEACTTIQSFSAMAHLESVHEDVCRLALDQNATIIILPFHKRWEIDGSVGGTNKAAQNMNVKVLDKAPCSVGILVDRGILNGWLSIFSNQSTYRVAVIFISGPDDAESLWYAARMAGRKNVMLTIFRFLLYGHDSARERKQDNTTIDQVCEANKENSNITYQEQVVKDGVGLAASLRTLNNMFDLVIVGKNHPASEILTRLMPWSECPELGIVGDILSSPDMAITASVLVVQQQRLLEDKVRDRMMRPVVIDLDLDFEED
ncbi:cation/H(+) antiporter 15-like [Andrographis paniculata]|uniref:cation/H(+) antiporter 15-like n=1 Tax=Andrographis paniculata TaxID=175694 RepID=UPI0021E77B07|nr:cation/H(+) antiporter 15-like [Andrographis paniculata]